MAAPASRMITVVDFIWLLPITKCRLLKSVEDPCLWT